MYESAVNDNAEDFPKLAVEALSPPLCIGVISPWFQILGKMPELRMMLKSLSIVNWNLWSVYFIISLRIPSTPQAFLYFIMCMFLLFDLCYRDKKILQKRFTNTSPFWIDNTLCCLFSVFQFSQKWLVYGFFNYIELISDVLFLLFP